jgi:hypothetical protein
VKRPVKSLKSKVVDLIKGTPKQKMRFTLVFQVDYEVDPETYTDPDPSKMGKEDTLSANEAPLTALKGMAELPGVRVKVKCEPIKTDLIVEAKA